jgi:hypothetical protein
VPFVVSAVALCLQANSVGFFTTSKRKEGKMKNPFEIRTSMDFEGLVPVRAAAEIYGCDRRRIYQLINEGRLKAIGFYDKMLVSVDDVLRLSREIKPRGIPRKEKKV